LIETARYLGKVVSEHALPDALLSERAGMATNERDERKAGITPAETTQPDSGDPRDTDHPTGSKQAAENAASDPPS
jgi:hypothetical protein